MTPGVAPERPRSAPGRGRLPLALAGALLALVTLAPPLATWARRYEVGDAVQFSILALLVPCLLVLGAPWVRLGLASPAGVGRPAGPRRMDALAAARRRHPQFARSLAVLAVYLVAVVLWRTPAAVRALAADRWLIVPEAISLIVLGMAMWLECIDSPPLHPRVSSPWRAVLAALAMWVIWTMAYVMGFSHTTWYEVFRHSGHGFSPAMDQQLATIVLWAAAGVVFVPVIFWDVTQWLRSEEDPDSELQRLLRQERRHRWASPGPFPKNEEGPGRPAA